MPYDDEIPPFVEPDEEMNALTSSVIAAAIEVHKHFGPGLDEALYENALCSELRRRGIPFECQKAVNVVYKDELIGQRKLDLVVGGKLVVELKAVEALTPLHKAQVKTYLIITGMQLGLLLNFNSILLKDGLKRVIQN